MSPTPSIASMHIHVITLHMYVIHLHVYIDTCVYNYYNTYISIHKHMQGSLSSTNTVKTLNQMVIFHYINGGFRELRMPPYAFGVQLLPKLIMKYMWIIYI